MENWSKILQRKWVDIIEELKHLIKVMAEALVDSPDQVHVTALVGEQTVVFELKVAKDDIGKIIGKEGKNARSLRTILLGASTKLRVRAVLEILE